MSMWDDPEELGRQVAVHGLLCGAIGFVIGFGLAWWLV